MILQALMNRFVPAIRPLERALLEALSEALPAEARAILVRQVASINLVQRHAEQKEICFFRMKWGRPSEKSDDAFPLKEEEVALATMKFSVTGTPVELEATYWLVRGFLFSVTLNRSPKEWMSERGVTKQQFRLHVNPMTAIRASDEKTTTRISIDAKLPDDYSQIVSKEESVSIGRCKVLGLQSIRQVVLSDATYIVLAEVQDLGTLAVKAGSTDGTIFFCDYDGGIPKPRGTSLGQAIEKLS